MIEPVFFSAAFEGLYLKGLAGRVTPALADELKAAGFDVHKPMLPAYPLATWNTCLLASARSLYAHLPVAEGIRALGVDFMRGFEHTLIGAATFTFARVIGVERTMQRMSHNARNTSNIYVSDTRREGPGHIVMNTHLAPDFVGKVPPMEPPLAHFMPGVVVGIFLGLGVKGAEVTNELVDPATHDVRIVMRWAP